MKKIALIGIVILYSIGISTAQKSYTLNVPKYAYANEMFKIEFVIKDIHNNNFVSPALSKDLKIISQGMNKTITPSTGLLERHTYMVIAKKAGKVKINKTKIKSKDDNKIFRTKKKVIKIMPERQIIELKCL